MMMTMQGWEALCLSAEKPCGKTSPRKNLTDDEAFNDCNFLDSTMNAKKKSQIEVICMEKLACKCPTIDLGQVESFIFDC